MFAFMLFVTFWFACGPIAAIAMAVAIYKSGRMRGDDISTLLMALFFGPIFLYFLIDEFFKEIKKKTLWERKPNVERK